MMELMQSLLSPVDSSIFEYDDMRHALDYTTKQEEITVIGGNFEIKEVIDGFKFTKKLRKTNKCNEKQNWIKITSERYSRYTYFLDNSHDDFPDICKNIKIINNLFEQKVLNLTNITKLVYKTDKKLIKYFKEWNLIK